MLLHRKGIRIGVQSWENILFVHWPIDERVLRPLVPKPFKINKWDGSAWLSAVAFTAKNTRLRKTPSLMAYPDFAQLNLRTYVNFGKEEGIFFLSIQSNDPFIVKTGKVAGLPFEAGKIDWQFKNHETVLHCLNDQKDRNLSLSYKGSHLPFNPMRESLDHFLTEKYCIWMIKGKNILKLPISHLPWTLQRVDVEIMEESLISQFISMNEKPVAHYSRFMTAYVHPYERFGIYH